MHSNAKKKLTIIFVVLAIACFAAYYFSPVIIKTMEAKAATGNNMGAMAATEVTVIKIEKQNMQQFLQLPGRVNAYRSSDVRPRVSGVIKKQIFKEGSLVKKGQQLYQIDPVPFQIEYNSTFVSLKTSKAKYQRAKNLVAVEAISKQDFDDAKAALAQAQANFNLAKNNLDYSKVYAPISGYIGKSNFTEGALLVANQEAVLATITQLDPIYVDMTEPSKEVLQIGDQKNIAVSLQTENGEIEEKGVLEFSEVYADGSTDSVNLRAKFSNHNKKLIPGMFVNAKLHLKPIDAITVPQRVTSRGPDGTLSVWVVDENNVANPRNLKATTIYGDSWIVEEGLNEGDIIIYEGSMKVMPGAKVKPVFLEEQNSTKK